MIAVLTLLAVAASQEAVRQPVSPASFNIKRMGFYCSTAKKDEPFYMLELAHASERGRFRLVWSAGKGAHEVLMNDRWTSIEHQKTAGGDIWWIKANGFDGKTPVSTELGLLRSDEGSLSASLTVIHGKSLTAGLQCKPMPVPPERVE